MKTLNQYLQGRYKDEKQKIEEIEDTLKDVFRTFLIYDKENGWPYELRDEGDKGKITDGLTFSYSTNSMILFTIGGLLNYIDGNSPLKYTSKWDVEWKKYKKDDTKDDAKDLTNAFDNIIGSILGEKKQDSVDFSKKIITYSGSYGENDPLTLSWLAELNRCCNDKLFQTGMSITTQDFNEICVDKVKKAFAKPDLDLIIVKKDASSDRITRKSSGHIFPLLRVIHLYKTLEEQKVVIWKESNSDKEKLYHSLINRINLQISHSLVQNSLFDTAELVLSLEGLLLIDDKKRIDDKLLEKIFEILQDNQKNNLYWRPLKPFVTSVQGDVLLPLSVEIANSLLRICSLLKKREKFLFYNYFEMFEKYTNWLLSNMSSCKIGEGENNTYRGWHSEHIQDHSVIHPWETAQAVIYLMNYKVLLQEHIAYKTLKYSGVKCDNKWRRDKKEDAWGDWLKSEPLLEEQAIYEDINNTFIETRPKGTNSGDDLSWSMLLYGPPGTGKSTIAEKIAHTLGWEMITITPSDFIGGGEADVESRAKSIFKTLEEQRNKVILFDEIDRLVLDRDSSSYAQQGDIFQFMTPSMLVKIKDLREKKRCIFIIATNYEERIDSAIKRAGRIDCKYLINPQNLKQRISIIQEYANELTKEKIEEVARANNVVLSTYGELKNIAKTLKRNPTIKTCDLGTPTIRISTYSRRFQMNQLPDSSGTIIYEDSMIFPFEEFFHLLYLKVEACETVEALSLSIDCEDELLTKKEKKVVKRVLHISQNKIMVDSSINSTDTYKRLEKYLLNLE